MLNRTEFVSALEEAVSKINESATGDLLTYVCNEVTDRVSLFLNLPNDSEKAIWDERLVKIVARIGAGVFTKTTANVEGNNDDTAISSISDNGQTISFGSATKNYLATATDNELFSGCSELLKPYRRINVIS